MGGDGVRGGQREGEGKRRRVRVSSTFTDKEMNARVRPGGLQGTQLLT